MSVDCNGRQWGCAKVGAVDLHRVGSMVRDMGEPCLHQSPIKDMVAVNKMLKPDKWQAAFDSDGKILGFQKALKLIILGGIDPSIRAEVWEFLLGCYALSSTAEYRTKLRTARRKRFDELMKQCQRMHASIGTGSLAYVVGSKVMDMRTYSKDAERCEAASENRQASEDTSYRLNDACGRNNNCTETTYAYQRESSSDSSDLASVRESTDSAAYDSSCLIPIPTKHNCHPLKQRSEAREPQYPVDLEFPALPVTNLFEKNGDLEKECDPHDSNSALQKVRLHEAMHSFQINNNEDLIIESDTLMPNSVRHSGSNIELAITQSGNSSPQSNSLKYKGKLINRLRISDAPEMPVINASTCQGGPSNRVSEWLWTLHRIVVDVVRTDSHLEFYWDPKNLARMSDILAVYAWVDPETGYCQGMSDILSPFVVLFEDNADAFWCFEMLLRRVRENFRMEGETGVMKQLQTLWHILELTDREMFLHLSQIGAESLHFAFRMLLVLFRRELSFSEALCMWEMMWAADFDESLAWDLDQNCLEPLMVQLPEDSSPHTGDETNECDDGSTKGQPERKHAADHSVLENPRMKPAESNHSFCGLTRNLWSQNDRMNKHTGVSVVRSREDQLPVFMVAAILILNRHKLIKETHSIDDLIKIFNDNLLKIKVRKCIRTAIKLRKKYFYKLIRSSTPQNGSLE